MKLLEGKNAVVTGAARGIGRVIALTFAKHGANLAILGRSVDDRLLSLKAECEAFGVKVFAYGADVSNIQQTTAFADAVVKDLTDVDILVNNAGITRDNLLMRMSEEQWDEVITVNLKSVFNLTKAFQRPMLKKKSGSIINLTSVVGVAGNAGQTNYAASKAGIIGFTKSVAKELGSRNIRCNAVAPGFIETDMTHGLSEEVKQEWLKNIPLKRAGSGEDVANACVFLGSDLSSYVSGDVLMVSGAMPL